MARALVCALCCLAASAWPGGGAAAQTTSTTQADHPGDLLAGKWQFSTDGGASFSDKLSELPPGATVLARTEFLIDDPGRYAALELTHGLDSEQSCTFALNGSKIEGPPELKTFAFKTIPGINPALLVRGTNVLTAEGYVNRQPAPSGENPLGISLVGLQSKDLKIVAGPVLGARGNDYLTVSCRTNVPCRVTVRINGSFPGGQVATRPDMPTTTWREITKSSPLGLFHQFYVDGVVGMQIGTEQVTAQTEDGLGRADMGPFTISALATPGGTLRFAAVGDARANPADWTLLAATILKARPQFVVHAGELVRKGRQEWRWGGELFAPAAYLFASVPSFIAPGNRDEDASMTALMFASPIGGEDWSRWQEVIGPVHLIGIDMRADWSAGGVNAQRLQQVLANSKAKFLFAVSRYSPWSSVRSTGQDVILPLLARYKATAMICGQEHVYERSEPPGGVTVIVTGGGPPTTQPTQQPPTRAPYSQVTATKLHYCLFTIVGEACTIQTLTPSGDVLDARTWPARDVKAESLTTQPAER